MYPALAYIHEWACCAYASACSRVDDSRKLNEECIRKDHKAIVAKNKKMAILLAEAKTKGKENIASTRHKWLTELLR